MTKQTDAFIQEGQMKNVRQGVKTRASGTPSFNRGLGTTRITPEKVYNLELGCFSFVC